LPRSKHGLASTRTATGKAQNVCGDELTRRINSLSPRALHNAVTLMRNAPIDRGNSIYHDFVCNGATHEIVFSGVDVCRLAHGIKKVLPRSMSDMPTVTIWTHRWS